MPKLPWQGAKVALKPKKYKRALAVPKSEPYFAGPGARGKSTLGQGELVEPPNSEFFMDEQGAAF